ncbi:NAD(P)/FAD-dependent oxidoreductase [Kribbella antibiotica]|uniref:NAD(P)/FAD-dependent oxidoreductase n=1 Tax=Kribbella antibiotica TaxID=190195 RepID=A0A4R4ZJE7_9ACTN|nr:NAD(P)/FAD-dependent oxidoreductase [Kribbella antibiotica]TDD58871.1 NAD(P)/FAD-dependent oxidoreductase [Kribbella antibiotica]
MSVSPRVLVVGGGPAGSTVAALLARAGVGVTLLERERFPRYHIGESLLASCLSTLRVSGAYDRVAAHGFQIKRGGVFLWQKDTWLLNWAALVDAEAWSWQVDRATFDDLLLRNASDQGAEVIEEATVKKVLFDDADRPVAVEWTMAGEDTVRTTEFDFLVDASGRAGVLAQKHFRMRRQHEGFRNIAIWSYWTGARLHPDSPEGAINVVSTPEGGWFWHIPLADGRFSVGYVISTRKAAEQVRVHGSQAAYYHDTIRNTPELVKLLEGATQVADIRADQDYSYVSDRLCGPGYVIVGDAALFLDPLLSTGVHLATYGALTAAASIATALRGEMSEPDALSFFDYTYRRAYERFLVLVSRMYQEYVGSDEYFSHASALTEAHADDTAQESFTRIMAGLTDVDESSGAQQRTGSDTIATKADGLHDYASGANISYMGHLDMSPVWNVWRDPLGADTAMGDLRVTTEPVLGLTRRPRTDAEKDAIARPVNPPVGAPPVTH